ncbi:hypothetical protein V6N13_143830 [Hibiscus sabdariffa]
MLLQADTRSCISIPEPEETQIRGLSLALHNLLRFPAITSKAPLRMFLYSKLVGDKGSETRSALAYALRWLGPHAMSTI